jgi:haloalkane dehalogenase
MNTASTPSIDAVASAHASAITRAHVVDSLRGTPHRWLDVGHSRLAYWRFGQGPDLVFVHGWPLNAATFRALVPQLASEFTCHLFDLPGAGKTETPDLVHAELRENATTLQRAATLLGLRHYAVLAHDSGGYVARALAANDERVAALVLGNTEVPGHTPWLIRMYTLTAKAPGGRAVMRALLSSRGYRRSPLAFGACFQDPDSADGEFDELILQPLLGSAGALVGQLALLRNLTSTYMADLPRIHAGIRARVRLIWGTADTFFPIEHARRMLPDFTAGAELCEIAGGRLFVHEEHPKRFVELARPFLRDALRG